MSRRTFIKQWNPAVPIGGRGRGRRKKGSDPNQAFSTAFRTLHDPADDHRRPGGRDSDGSARFYSATGLTTTGIPLPEGMYRFRAQTLSTRGGRGRGGLQQRVGMFRNAIQSNVIFGGPSERVLRHSRRKIDRLIAPESDVPESVSEWRRSPSRNTQRRRDVYEYESEDEDEDERDEPVRYQPRRRVSNQRRAPPEPRREAEYDPYEFRDDDSEDEPFEFHPPPTRQRRSTSRLTVGGPSSSRAPSAYARERLRTQDERVRPRRLFDGPSDEEEEEMDRRRGERRAEERREELPRMEKRNSKRARELSPARLPLAAARHPVARRHSAQRRDAAAAAPAAATPVVRFGDQENVDGAQKEKQSAANYTPSIAHSIARRILSGLPPIRLKEGDGSESYLAASRSIISGALERFTADEQDEAEADVPPGDGQPPADGQDAKNPGRAVMRALFERTQHINVSEESEDEEEEEEAARVGGAFENIFSRHTSDSSPVLERLFDKTMRDAAMGKLGPPVEEEEEEEVDTAKMLGLDGGSEQAQPHSAFDEIGEEDPFNIVPRTAGESTVSASRTDPFEIVPRTAGESTSSGSERSSSTDSLFSNRGHRKLSMAAAAHRSSLALMGPPQMESMQQRGTDAGPSGRSTDYSDRSDRSNASAAAAAVERSFQFQLSASNRTAPPNHFIDNHKNGSFNFGF